MESAVTENSCLQMSHGGKKGRAGIGFKLPEESPARQLSAMSQERAVGAKAIGERETKWSGTLADLNRIARLRGIVPQREP
jgi:hypothetical protein